MNQGLTPALGRLMADVCSPWALSGYDAGTPLLLALSGGADSRLLLHLLASEARTTGAVLHLAHLHHGIRGAAADRDADFCRALAKEYALPLHIKRVDVPALAREHNLSLEEAGRRARYEFFAEVMQKERIPLLATAHHADDNLETLLLRLSRGCGTAGLAGIAPVRPFAAAQSGELPLPPLVVRPLLACAKEDILAALEELSLSYVTDDTNTDLSYTRNALRHRVLPALYELSPHIRVTAARAMRSLREDDACLNALADALLARQTVDGTLDCAALCEGSPAIAKRAIARHITRHAGVTPAACHIEAVLSLCQDSRVPRSVHLPEGLVVRAERGRLHLDRTQPGRHRHTNAPLPCALQEGTVLLAPDIRITLCDAPMSDQHQKNTQNAINVYNPFIRDTLRFDTIMKCAAWCHATTWHLRPRRPGDTLLYRGHHRRVRKLQNDIGLPAALRERLPLLCDYATDTVLWVPFVGARDGLLAPLPTDVPSNTLSLTIEVLPDEAIIKEESFS